MDKFEKFLDSTYRQIADGVRMGKPKLSKVYPTEIKIPFRMLTNMPHKTKNWGLFR